jgi:hypothetical protein
MVLCCLINSGKWHVCDSFVPNPEERLRVPQVTQVCYIVVSSIVILVTIIIVVLNDTQHHQHCDELRTVDSFVPDPEERLRVPQVTQAQK